MKNCPLAAQILLKYAEGLAETQLNRNIKKFLFEELRKTPNIESIDSLLQAMESFMSDDISSKNMNYGKKNSVFCTREDREREENEGKGGQGLSVTRSINTNLLNVPTPVGTVGEEATIKALSASSNTPGNVTKRKEK